MIKRELTIFLIVGSLTVLVDYLSYHSLIWIDLMSIDIAKASGFIIGTVFAYIANRFWTFGHKQHAPGSLWRFSFLYTTTLATNVFVNAQALVLLGDAVAAFQIAFLFATGVSATLNFLGMKLFVFKARSVSEAV